ncbi:hypothetical protein GCM10027343_43710 [Noviherbaspirillum agri]
MEHLYQHRYASYEQLQVYGHVSRDTIAYVAHRGDTLVAALLYRVAAGRVTVLNEQMRLNEEEIERFAGHVFSSYPSVHAISFPVVQAETRRLPFPHQQFHSTQDIVLDLPGSVEEYIGRLGKSTRSYVKRYLNKLKREHPSFTFTVFTNEEIRAEHVRAIIGFNKARMSGRNKESYIDEQEERRILELLKLRGFVGVVTIDGKVCAGTINTCFGKNYFLQVIAHDPAYDDYGLGTLCCYLTICECIARKGGAYHFLWGQYEYKYRLLGVQRDLDHIVVYRSRRHMLAKLPMVAGMAYNGYKYTARSWLLNKARRKDDSSVVASLAYYLVNGVRNGKRAVERLLHRQQHVA